MIQRTKIWTILTIRTNIAFSLFGQNTKTNNKIEQYCQYINNLNNANNNR